MGSRTRAAIAALLMTLVMVGLPASASAAPPQKVTICHATGSSTNPYNEITVSEKALDAHRAHQDGQDIIPAPPTGCETDLCPNIPDLQLVVPSGLVVDAAGNCVPADVCPNIPGDQAEVPEGFIVDAEGDCVPEPQPCNTSTVSGGQGTTVTSHELGEAGPLTFQFDYNTVFQPDRLTIRYEGNVVFDTMVPVSTSDMVVTEFVNLPAGTSTQVEVTVEGPEPGTVWEYTVHCPTS